MDVDQMVDDIFDQEENKNTKNLKQISKYKSNEYLGDDDFDIAYRTPKDINPEDLLPTEFTVDEKENDEIFKSNKDALGYFDCINNEIHIRAKRNIDPQFIGRASNYGNFNSFLIHENAHKKQYDNRNNQLLVKNDESCKLKKRKIKTEYDYFDENIGKTNDADVMFLKKKSAAVGNPIGPKTTEMLKQTPHEPLAYFSQFFPEEVINPQSKLAKKANRMWFD